MLQRSRGVFFRLCISKASFVDVSHTFATFLFEATVLKCRFRFIFASSHIRCWLVERHLRISTHCNFSAKMIKVQRSMLMKSRQSAVSVEKCLIAPALAHKSVMFSGPIRSRLQWRDVYMALRLCDTIKTNMTLQNNKIIMIQYVLYSNILLCV